MAYIVNLQMVLPLSKNDFQKMRLYLLYHEVWRQDSGTFALMSFWDIAGVTKWKDNGYSDISTASIIVSFIYQALEVK